MVQEHWWRDGEVAEGLKSAQAARPAPLEHVVDWDGPFGDEPCVPIIYDPA